MQEMLRFGELPAAPLTGIELRLRSRRSRASRLDVKLLVAAAAVVLLVVLAFTVGPLRSNQHRVATSSPSHGIPHGWATYSAYGLQISVPKSWSVQYFGQCPDGQKPGTLFIGTSQFVDNCPEIRIRHQRGFPLLRWVDTSRRRRYPDCGGSWPEHLGVPVRRHRRLPLQRTSDLVCACVQRNGHGLRTRLTHRAANLEAATSRGHSGGRHRLRHRDARRPPGGSPVTGKLEATDTRTGKKRSVLVIDGQFWFEGAPGPYRLRC